MSQDTFIVECPLCKEQFPVATYSGNCSGEFYGVDSIPLKLLIEVSDEAVNGRVICIHCGTAIAIQILYITNIRPLANCERENWRIN